MVRKWVRYVFFLFWDVSSFPVVSIVQWEEIRKKVGYSIEGSIIITYECGCGSHTLSHI